MNFKLPIGPCLIICICLFSECSVNDNKKPTQQSPTSAVEEIVNGGIIVYDSAGHGLIAAPGDIGRFNWSDAMKTCDELMLNGYEDWRLPTKDELNKLYTHLKSNSKGNFESESYWSSNEYNEYYAWRQNFKGGRVDRRGKKVKENFVRPVRSF